MKWTEKQQRIAEVILENRAENEHGFEFKPVMETLLSEGSISKSQISDVGKELRAKNWEIVKEQGTEHTGGNGGGTALAEVKLKGSPVKFSIKGEEITLQADNLFSTYFIYLDLKRRLGIEDSFSEAIVIGMQTLWKLTSQVSVVMPEGG